MVCRQLYRFKYSHLIYDAVKRFKVFFTCSVHLLTFSIVRPNISFCAFRCMLLCYRPKYVYVGLSD
jgi:hypothetical protein